MSLPLRILLQAIANAALMWGMTVYLPQYVTVLGGIPAYVLLGGVIAMLNSFVRPILNVLALPIKLFATLVAIIIVNGAILYLVYRATLFIDPTLLTFVVSGGLVGWIVVSLIVGTANWVMKLLFK